MNQDECPGGNETTAVRGHYAAILVPPESRRIAPRPRHEVSPGLLVVLRLLFRYSYWRDAWILRGIGEWHGPVLRPAERPAAAKAGPVPSRAPRIHRHKRSRPIRVRAPSAVLPLGRTPLMALALPGIVVAGALGFMMAPGHGARQSLPTLTEHVSSGVLRVSVPSGWRRQVSPASTAQLGLSDELALAPAASRGAMLVMGRTVTTDPQLLPQSLLASLPATPRSQTITVGRISFYRYLNLLARGESTSESVYAVPTTVGTVLGVCRTGKAQPGFTSTCERSLATLRLTSGTVLPLGPSPRYASALDAVISRLNAARRGLDAQLRDARTPRAQARAASALAAAHAEAASALLRLAAGPASAASAATAGALKVSERAYGALALAAAQDDARAYRAASSSLQRATKALDAALARLSALGYRFS